MSDFVIITLFALVVCGIFYFLGNRKPALPFWVHVDLYYYPLGVIGVIFLFLSAAEGRHRLSILTEYQEQRASEVVSAANVVLKSSFQLSKFIIGVVDPSRTCRDGMRANPWLDGACQKQSIPSKIFQNVAQVIIEIVEPGGFPQQLMRISFSPSCTAVIDKASDKAMWEQLHTIRREFDDEARRTASMLYLDVANACKRYQQSLANQDVPPELYTTT